MQRLSSKGQSTQHLEKAIKTRGQMVLQHTWVIDQGHNIILTLNIHKFYENYELKSL